jgi:two-component system chemotaxis sensor kinase CheA
MQTSEFGRDPALIAEFVCEAEEHLDRVDDLLLQLEKYGYRRALSAEALRALHSVKGSAGYLDLFDVQAVCHSGEGLLGELESASGAERSRRIDLVFDIVTQLRTALAALRLR